MMDVLEQTDVLDAEQRRAFHHHSWDHPIAFCGAVRPPGKRNALRSTRPCCPECRQVMDPQGLTCCNEQH